VKRLLILSKMLMLLVCFSVMLSAANAGSTINNRLMVPYVADAPLNDGLEDASWTFQDVGIFTLVDGNPPESAEDCSGWFKLAWNEDALYLFVHVVDDTLVSHENSWRADCVEIFIDGGNEKAGSLDANDVQWRWVAGEDTLALCYASGDNLRPAEYYLEWTKNSDGYDMELEVPVAGLEKLGASMAIAMAAGTEIGFDLQVTDNDSAAGNDEAFRWWADGGSDYGLPSNWGTVNFSGSNDTLQIPEVAIAPYIDGDLDAEWTNALVPEITMSVIGGGTPNCPDGGKPDFSTYFRAAWDADGFYLFGRVVDDSISLPDPVGNDWQCDCWEIYFDGDDSKSSDYTDGNDVQWRFVYGQDSATQGPSSSECDIEWVQTADGYNVELAIPTATLADTNITLALNAVIGFEVQVSDNDSTTREGITKWWNKSNDSYLNPNLFGTAILSVLNDDKVPEKELASNIKLSAPAILTSNATIKYTVPARSSVKLSLYNLAGQEVKTLVNEAQSAGVYSVSLDASGLANGVYMARLEACNETSTKKVTVLK